MADAHKKEEEEEKKKKEKKKQLTAIANELHDGSTKWHRSQLKWGYTFQLDPTGYHRSTRS